MDLTGAIPNLTDAIPDLKKFQILTLDPPVPLRNFWYYNRVKILADKGYQ